MGKKKQSIEYIYSEHTYDSNIGIQRLSHRTRFNLSLQLMKLDKNQFCLDYGCGDGKFLLELVNTKKALPANLFGFDPYLPPLENLPITLFKDFESTLQCAERVNKFDYITCFEMMEHFSPLDQEMHIEKILQLLKQDGTVIISVPIEIYFPSLVKGMVRKLKYKAIGYNYKNIFLSLIGRPPQEQRLVNGQYHGHLGFNYNDLKKILQKYFTIEKKIFSPFFHLGPMFNSQVFFVLKRK